MIGIIIIIAIQNMLTLIMQLAPPQQKADMHALHP